MSSINEDLLKTINEFISSQSSNIDKKELLEVIKDVFSKHKKSKKDNSVEKVKRKPSAYNLFMKKTMEELKENGMTAKDKMKRVADLWKEFKNSPAKTEETFVDADDVIEEDEISTPMKPVEEPKKEQTEKKEKKFDNSKFKTK